jgi:hypothetical protein
MFITSYYPTFIIIVSPFILKCLNTNDIRQVVVLLFFSVTKAFIEILVVGLLLKENSLLKLNILSPVTEFKTNACIKNKM